MLLSVKVLNSEEPEMQPEDGGFNDLNKGHLQVICYCHSCRAMQLAFVEPPSPLWLRVRCSLLPGPPLWGKCVRVRHECRLGVG